MEFNEPGGAGVLARLSEFTEIVSSNLLEAEARAAHSRNNRHFSPTILSNIEWIFPDRPLSAEMERVLEAGYLRGADLFHVAVALYFAGNPADIWFITLDNDQRAVAAALGFQT